MLHLLFLVFKKNVKLYCSQITNQVYNLLGIFTVEFYFLLLFYMQRVYYFIKNIYMKLHSSCIQKIIHRMVLLMICFL